MVEGREVTLCFVCFKLAFPVFDEAPPSLMMELFTFDNELSPIIDDNGDEEDECCC